MKNLGVPPQSGVKDKTQGTINLPDRNSIFTSENVTGSNRDIYPQLHSNVSSIEMKYVD